MSLGRVILAILLPPLAVIDKGCGSIVIVALLTVIGWVPGVLAAIERAAVDGVVLQNIRFCDLHGSENSLFERDLEAKGIPCLKIEREYGPLVETGRIRMRLEAFLERLG